ncbi:MAG TPA: DedA family protein [Actinomycetota bacterium]|nr:DedA family protein [Actinomycetota bacterium]
MGHLLDALKIWIEASIKGPSGYAAIFFLMLLESAAIPVPSEITMPVAGLLAQAGRFNFVLVAMLGTLGNLVGSWIAYGMGRYGGRALLIRYGRFVMVKPHDIERADAWFERYGGRAVFWSRLVPVVRTFISVPAGVARMPLVRFSLLTFVGCLPWSFALTYVGFALGERWKDLLPYADAITYVIAGGLLLLIAIWFYRRIRAKAR